MLHESGIEDEAELAYVSMQFWLYAHDRLDPGWNDTTQAWDQLLGFQKGWKACKEYYKIED